MKKFVLYNNESDSEPVGVFDDTMLNNEHGFTDADIQEILNLDILETAVLDMNNIVLRVWDI
jgi:hypothetical protein